MDAVIQPIVPHSLQQGISPGALPRVIGPLPIPDIPAPRSTALVYGMTIMDSRGRIANQTVLQALSSAAATCLAVESTADLLILRPSPAGEVSVLLHGHLRLPATIRHRHGLAAGDRLLLAADPARDVLIVCPPAVLDNLVIGLMGGDQP